MSSSLAGSYQVLSLRKDIVQYLWLLHPHGTGVEVADTNNAKYIDIYLTISNFTVFSIKHGHTSATSSRMMLRLSDSMIQHPRRVCFYEWDTRHRDCDSLLFSLTQPCGEVLYKTWLFMCLCRWTHCLCRCSLSWQKWWVRSGRTELWKVLFLSPASLAALLLGQTSSKMHVLYFPNCKSQTGTVHVHWYQCELMYLDCAFGFC